MAAIKTSIWDQTNQFLRKLLNIFDMQRLGPSDPSSLLSLVDGLKFFFEDKKNEVLVLERDVKILILNAKQKKFCEELKVSMEKENWTAIKFGKKESNGRRGPQI